MTLIKFNSDANRSLLPGINDVFESIFNDTFVPGRMTRTLPAVNMSESEDFYHVEMAAPGLRKEDFNVTVDRSMLTISCQNSDGNKKNDKRYAKKEYSYSSFMRSFNLPELADPNKIEASYENGILKLDISKREEAKSQAREIELK